MKNILITGVSTGIGYDALRHFVARGYSVFGSVRNPEDAERLLRDFPENFVCLLFDVTDSEAMRSAAKQVEQQLAGQSLTALVNNAGFAQAGPMALLSDEAFRRQMEVNLVGVRNVTNAFLPLLGARPGFEGLPGKIINISSISGIFNTPMNGAYCVAKHALESLGEVYRRELMMYGIQVASIQPGPIESDLWEKNLHAMDAYLNTDYATMAKRSNDIMQDAQKNALPAEVISRLIEKIIDSRRPKLSYIVSKNRLRDTLLVRYVPRRLADWLVWRSLGV